MMMRTIRRLAVCLFMVILAAVSIPSMAQSSYTLPLVLPASNAALTGFVRIINRSFQSGTVSITAIDDTGERFGPVSLSLEANETVNFNSHDLEQGNAAKGLPAGVGDGSGSWRLVLETSLNINPLAYIRTTDGFVTSMHDDIVPTIEAASQDHRYRVPFFNPGYNTRQVSRLRLINPGTSPAEIEITGRDDAGMFAPGGAVSVDLPPGGARTLTAQALENGGNGFTGSLGAGTGKWQLSITSDIAIEVMSLLQSPTGHLANLSSVPEPGVVDMLTLPLVLPASNTALTGFVRIINRSGEGGTVSITAIDDTGERFGPVSLSLEANETVNFNSHDLEQGNAAKGLPAGVGDGEGNWRLELETSLDVVPLAYIRTADGFVTGMRDVVTASGQQYQVPFFNPGANTRQVSLLRLINPGTNAAEITVLGRDDAGTEAPGGPVSLTLAPGASRMLTAQNLEAGGNGLDGSLGAGTGKYRLFVSNDRSIKVMSLLQSPTGHLSNLSGIPYPTTPLTFAGAEPVTISNGEIRLSGQLNSPDDVDYYRMRLDNPTFVQFPNMPGVVLTVFDSQGNVVTRIAGSGGAPEGAEEFAFAAPPLLMIAGEFLITIAPIVESIIYAGIIGAGIYYIIDATELRLSWGGSTDYDLKKQFQGERSAEAVFSIQGTVRTRYGSISLSVGLNNILRASHTPAQDAPCGTGSEPAIKFPVTAKVVIPAVGVERERTTNLQIPIKITRESAPRRKGDDYAIIVNTDETDSMDVYYLNLNRYVEDPDGGPLTFTVSDVPPGWRLTPQDNGILRVEADPIADDSQAILTARDSDGECWNFPLLLVEDELSDEQSSAFAYR